MAATSMSTALVPVQPVFAESEAEATQALALLDTCPVRDKAIVAVPYAPADLASWFDAVMSNYPTGYRYATDNMWTSASADETRLAHAPRLRRAVA